MAEFGGLGGFYEGRAFNPEDLFEATVERVFGERLRAEGKGHGWWDFSAPPMLGSRIYGSITNQDWQHENGDTAGYSFRAAGDLVAAIVGEGDYLDWYCSAPEGVVDEEVAAALAKEGWRPIEKTNREQEERDGVEAFCPSPRGRS